jgi:hypothetical protein
LYFSQIAIVIVSIFVSPCQGTEFISLFLPFPLKPEGLYDCFNKWNVSEVALLYLQAYMIKDITTATCFSFSLEPLVLGTSHHAVREPKPVQDKEL